MFNKDYIEATTIFLSNQKQQLLQMTFSKNTWFWQALPSPLPSLCLAKKKKTKKKQKQKNKKH